VGGNGNDHIERMRWSFARRMEQVSRYGIFTRLSKHLLIFVPLKSQRSTLFAFNTHANFVKSPSIALNGSCADTKGCDRGQGKGSVSASINAIFASWVRNKREMISKGFRGAVIPYSTVLSKSFPWCLYLT
jgi:hypothetical protein